MKTSTKDWSIPTSSYSRTYTRYKSPSGEVTNLLKDLVNKYNQAYQKAYSANKATYGSMMDTANQYLSTIQGAEYDVSDLYEQAYGELEGAGSQRAADIVSDYEKLGASEEMKYSRLGFGNTVMTPVKAGIEREKQNALTRLAEELASEKAGVLQNQAQAQLQSVQSQMSGLGGAYSGLLNTMGKYGFEATPDRASLQSLVDSVTSQYGGGQGISTLLKTIGDFTY